jgi:hypothetical protein
MLAEKYGIYLSFYEIYRMVCCSNYPEIVDFTPKGLVNRIQSPIAYIDLNGASLADDHMISFDDDFKLDEETLVYLAAYPRLLVFTKKASKNDVIKFLDEQWLAPKISSWRMNFESSSQIRLRSYSRKLFDALWKYRDKSMSERRQMLTRQFPQYTLGDNEITKLLSEERKRRLNDLNTNYQPSVISSILQI